jgi:hypothetical protein
LGNDVNLRDFEGRSALLLGKAKDNNASTSLGPFIRLFDDSFTMDDVRNRRSDRSVDRGPEGYRSTGTSKMSRDQPRSDRSGPPDAERASISDGFALFLGTLFAPIQDRDDPGRGFTHKVGDVVSISTPKLGSLVNRVTTSKAAPPWQFGIRDLMRNLAGRGLLSLIQNSFLRQGLDSHVGKRSQCTCRSRRSARHLSQPGASACSSPAAARASAPGWSRVRPPGLRASPSRHRRRPIGGAGRGACTSDRPTHPVFRRCDLTDIDAAAGLDQADDRRRMARSTS